MLSIYSYVILSSIGDPMISLTLQIKNVWLFSYGGQHSFKQLAILSDFSNSSLYFLNFYTFATLMLEVSILNSLDR